VRIAKTLCVLRGDPLKPCRRDCKTIEEKNQQNL